jgi:hypothetical protein
MFDFVSPFDAFNQPVSTQPSTGKRATQQTSAATLVQSSGDDSVSKHPLEGHRSDTKRKSFDNLMDTLSRSSAGQPLPSSVDKSQDRTVSESRVPPTRRQPGSPQLIHTQASKPAQRVSSPAHASARDQSQQRSEGPGQGGWRPSNKQPPRESRSDGSP